LKALQHFKATYDSDMAATGLQTQCSEPRSGWFDWSGYFNDGAIGGGISFMTNAPRVETFSSTGGFYSWNP
jgi:hypothetical protein